MHHIDAVEPVIAEGLRLDVAQPANPPPTTTTTTRRCACARSGAASTAAATLAAAPPIRVLRLGMACCFRVCEPRGNCTRLFLGKPFGDAVHHGRRALAGAERLHLNNDVGCGIVIEGWDGRAERRRSLAAGAGGCARRRIGKGG